MCRGRGAVPFACLVNQVLAGCRQRENRQTPDDVWQVHTWLVCVATASSVCRQAGRQVRVAGCRVGGAVAPYQQLTGYPPPGGVHGLLRCWRCVFQEGLWVVCGWLKGGLAQWRRNREGGYSTRSMCMWQ
jgi:hypothetical protein